MSGVVGQTGTRSGNIFCEPPSFNVEGDNITSTTVWPPPPLDLKAPTGIYFVGKGITLNTSSNYVTLGCAGTYQIYLDVRHDVGASQATTATTLNFLYVKKGPAAFTNTGTYDYSVSIGSANGTRSQEDGFINTVGSCVQYFPAGTHIWPGGFNRANITMKCYMFHGIMIK
jgi:hypothetical protein